MLSASCAGSPELRSLVMSSFIAIACSLGSGLKVQAKCIRLHQIVYRLVCLEQFTASPQVPCRY